MKKNRLIPIVLLKNGWIVQSKLFKEFRKIGNPKTNILRFSEWQSDELIFLDISRNDYYNLNRDDLNFNNNTNLLDIIKDISKVSFMPITIGGKIRNLKDVENYLLNGADKVSINSEAQANPNFINEVAKEFGSQCIVNSVDVKKVNGNYRIFYNFGTKISNYLLDDWIKISQDMGSGEFLINSIDHDGMCQGFDLNLACWLKKKCKIPVIFCGGAGNYDHFYDLINRSGLEAVAAANFFQFSEQSIFFTKKNLYDRGLNFRRPELMSVK
jgi:cyclase